MKVSPYLSFNGQCDAALAFYARCLGGQLGSVFRYGGSPMANQAPRDWRDKVMHGSLRVGDLVNMGRAVVPEDYEAPQGFSLSISPRWWP